MSSKTDDACTLTARTSKPVAAPPLPYQPRDPQHYRPAIGLIACGGITAHHLNAYQQAGYHVAALCDLVPSRARKWKAKFYPDAKVYRDYREVLRRDDIEVVDVATHPAERMPIIEEALRAGKHVLSQKPFVLDLGFGQRMVDLADRQGVRLAVNQNGRWAPHFSYLREAIRAGLLGQVTAAHLSVHWDHNWVKGTAFDQVQHLLLYDFAIHWFDMLTCIFGDLRATRVYASLAHSPQQAARPALLAQALVEYDGAQASLAFDADTHFGPQDRTYVAGTLGSVSSVGPDLKRQTLTLATAAGQATPVLEGHWFDDGFHGTMGELLCAIEEGREPFNGARDNLRSLELCFAAVASAERHKAVTPGSVRVLPGANLSGR
ncbi:MAG: Gfo/Idh/MocA family oxidoreductase [Thermoguttaceae bacterium]